VRPAALAGILLAAALARVFAIDFCLPSHYCRPDEEAVGSVVMRVLGRDLNPHWFDWPSLFMYLTALGLVPFFKVGNALGWYRGEYHFLQVLTADPEPVYLAARLLSASTGVVSVWLLYRTARRWFGHLEALVAAAFLALAFLHVRDSHFGVTDVTATCLGLASFACTVRFHAYPGRHTLVPAAALGGLAASTKYNLALILVPLAAAIALSADRRPAGKVVRDLVVAGAGAVAGFLVATPYALLDYPAFVEGLRGISTHLAGGHGADVGSGWWVHLTSSLRYGLGWPLLAAGLGGLALLLVQRPQEGWLLALFPITYYALIGSGRTTFARYIVPVVPFLCLAAAFLVGTIARAASARISSGVRPPVVAAALAIVVAAPSAWSTWQFLGRLAMDDSRVLAARWIRQRFPEGAVIGQAGRVSTYLYFPRDVGHERPRYVLGPIDSEDTRPDVIVVPSSPLERRPERPPALQPVLSHYAREHVVTAYEPEAATEAVYDWQDEFYLPLAGFGPIIRPGPTLEIFVRR
jgi:hypothetical protein